MYNPSTFPYLLYTKLSYKDSGLLILRGYYAAAAIEH
jgi:hypothetical protein